MENWSNATTMKADTQPLPHSTAPALRQSNPPVPWSRHHLLDIESLTAEEILTVLDTARAFKAVG